MKTPAQWREIYPVAEEVVKAIQEDARAYVMEVYERVFNDILLGIRRGLTEPISPHPVLPVFPDPAQRVADPAGNPCSGGREGGEG